MVKDKLAQFLESIDTVHGHCPHCGEESILVAIVTDYYRCTVCGEDTKQYVNGSIKYLRISKEDEEWLKKRSSVLTTMSKEKE